MKKILCTLILLCCMFTNTIASASMLLEYDGGIHNYTGSIYTLSVNGSTLSNLPLEPIIFNDRALVPVREVFEALGASVDYDGSDKSIYVSYSSHSVQLQIDSPVAVVDGVSQTIPDGLTPKLIAKWGDASKTMVPVRFLSESIGLDVEFDGSRGHISVADGNKPQATPVPSIKATFGDVTYYRNGNITVVNITANEPVSEITKAGTTDSGTVYINALNSSHSTPNRVDINTGSVTAVRFGLHEDGSTRIAVDTVDMKKYNVYLSEDRKAVVFEISSDENAELTPPPTPTPVPTPEPTPAPTAAPEAPVREKIVVLDAGHGGQDPGTRGSLMTDSELAAYHSALQSSNPIIATMKPGSGTTILEKEIAMNVTRKVQSLLEQQGVKVILTRYDDTYPNLHDRVNTANSNQASIFMSIHLNSTTTAVTSAKGIEIFYSEQNNADFYGSSSKDLASTVLDEVLYTTGAKSRGVKTGNLLVTRESTMPAALIELGFMNNPDELRDMATDDYQNKLASGIAGGIMKVYNRITLQ